MQAGFEVGLERRCYMKGAMLLDAANQELQVSLHRDVHLDLVVVWLEVGRRRTVLVEEVGAPRETRGSVGSRALKPFLADLAYMRSAEEQSLPVVVL